MNNKIFLDVRTPQEFKEIHIKGSSNIPLDKLGNYINELAKLDKEIILVCRSGARACTAQKILAQNGIANTTVLEGGVMNLNPNKYPLESG
ncbi:MAG TPA: rhodanese-like domain-containing protein [Nanoarchaeota archaeon]|nr:rhodanese-like domain-containing protein [Nanoarchaeota archaeon]HIH63370.1 rhodanese-like domain-containing protein [Nanoarchaeota archaeon]HIJ09747.1 rhodanese-like domain-containing protein [Nanoarchaeota archaeon]